ncbi:unnamed protein product [Cochlearia groenlandica]
MRDPKKQPTARELYDALMEIPFTPSRFPDTDTLRKLGIYDEGWKSRSQLGDPGGICTTKCEGKGPADGCTDKSSGSEGESTDGGKIGSGSEVDFGFSLAPIIKNWYEEAKAEEEELKKEKVWKDNRPSSAPSGPDNFVATRKEAYLESLAIEEIISPLKDLIDIPITLEEKHQARMAFPQDTLAPDGVCRVLDFFGNDLCELSLLQCSSERESERENCALERAYTRRSVISLLHCPMQS